jgi:hypothetical protein
MESMDAADADADADDKEEVEIRAMFKMYGTAEEWPKQPSHSTLHHFSAHTPKDKRKFSNTHTLPVVKQNHYCTMQSPEKNVTIRYTSNSLVAAQAVED